MNRRLQGRLAKELRLAGLYSMEDCNIFLSEFLHRFNERFAVRAIKPENRHRTLNRASARLSDIRCDRKQRHVI